MTNKRDTLSYKLSGISLILFIIGVSLSMGSLLIRISYGIITESFYGTEIHSITDYTILFGIILMASSLILLVITEILKAFDR